MSDFFAEVERELRVAAARRAHLPWYRRLTQRPFTSPARLRISVVALVLVCTTTTVTLAASGVILTGSPVRPARRPVATAGEGIPVLGSTRLLALRAADPAGGLPWGMRIVHTTRGLICVQIGRVDHGQLGELGVDGAFGDDGRFHALPADALPDVLSNFEGWDFENCAAPGSTYAGDVVGLELSAASNPPAGAGVPGDRREISFGLLGSHAVSIAYRSGAATRTESVLPGLGAYLLVQRYTSGRRLGGVSETDGSDQRYPYSDPTSPNGALSAITYRYAGRSCTDTGRGRILRACGLSESPPPRPAPLPIVREPLQVHLQIHHRVITGAEIRFPAPYPVTNASQDYFLSAHTGGELSGSGSDANVARGATVTIPIEGILSLAGTRSVAIEVSYTRFGTGIPESTTVGTATVREPPGTHAPPAPRPRRRRVRRP